MPATDALLSLGTQRNIFDIFPISPKVKKIVTPFVHLEARTYSEINGNIDRRKEIKRKARRIRRVKRGENGKKQERKTRKGVNSGR